MPPITKSLRALLGGVLFSMMCSSTAGAACVEPSQQLRHTGLTLPRAATLVPRLAEGQPGPVADNDGRHAGSLVNRIVGTWLVVYGGPLASQAFIQWHSDGTEWENIDLPTLGGNICMGDWRVVDENHVGRSHVGWLFSNGNPAGYFTQTETDEVAKDGSWYRGTNYIRMYDLDGTQVFEGAGTAEATRIPAP